MEGEMGHYTVNGVLHHITYEHTARKGGVSWTKVYGSETPCHCPDREHDRQALRRVKETVQ